MRVEARSVVIAGGIAPARPGSVPFFFDPIAGVLQFVADVRGRILRLLGGLVGGVFYFVRCIVNLRHNPPRYLEHESPT